MPGVKSLDEQQYYAHPQNVFWLIMSGYLGFDIQLKYSEKLKHLSKNQIALWDVIGKCKREGSLDSAIVKESIQPNNFSELFKKYPSIRTILFNGAMAEKAFQQYVIKAKQLDANIVAELVLQRMPSTSPANASMKKLEKIKIWKTTLNRFLR